MAAWQARGRGREERGKGSRTAWLGGAMGRGSPAGGAVGVTMGLQPAAASCVLSAVRERTGREEGEKEEREKKKKRKEKKRKKGKIWKIFQT
jgi:hypothetical protein